MAIKRANAMQFDDYVGLRIDELIPVPYFAVLFLTLMKEIEAYIAMEAPSGTHDIYFQWPAELRSNFEPDEDDELKQLRVNTDASGKMLFNHLLHAVIHFLRRLKELGMDAQTIENSPISFFTQAFDHMADLRERKRTEEQRSIMSAEAHRQYLLSGTDKGGVSTTYAATMKELIEGMTTVVGGPADNAEQKQIRSWGIPVLEKNNSSWVSITLRFATGKKPEHIRYPFTALAMLCRKFLAQYHNDRYGHSALLPGIALDKVHLLGSRTLALPQTPETSRIFTGFFSVIREARGTVTNTPSHRHCVVRDLLWLRPHRSLPNPVGISDIKPKPQGSRLGYYFSAFDRLVYEVRRVAVDDRYMMFDAVAHLNREKTKHMTAYFPLMSNGKYNWSPGGMLGHALGTQPLKRVGGWTGIFYRPDLPPDFAHRLQNELSIYSESLAIDMREEYDRNVVGLFEYVDSFNQIGILFSDAMIKEASPPERDRLISLSRAFRKFFSFSREHMQTIEDEVDRVVDEVYHDMKLLKKFIHNLVVEQMMYCITPTFDPSVSSSLFDEELELLSAESALVKADAYFEAFPSPSYERRVR